MAIRGQRIRNKLRYIYKNSTPSSALTVTDTYTTGVYGKGDTIYVSATQDTTTLATISKVISRDTNGAKDTYTTASYSPVYNASNQLGVHLITTGTYKDTEGLEVIYIHGGISARKTEADSLCARQNISDVYASAKWMKMRSEIIK